VDVSVELARRWIELELTMGVVLFLVVVLFGFFALKGYLKGKASSTFARFKAAEAATARSMLEGDFEHPSWITDNALANQSARGIVKDAVKRGMTEERAREWFSRPYIRGGIATMAANLERQGFSLAEQIAGAAQFAEKLGEVELRGANGVRVEDTPPQNPVGEKEIVEDGDLLLTVLDEGLAENRIVHGGAIPFDNIEAFYDRYWCDVPPMWASKVGYRAGGGLVEVGARGKCLVWFALTPENTFMVAQKTPFGEVTSDNKPDLVAAIEEGFAQWVDAVPELASQARQLTEAHQVGSRE
jgi:hypothetical protein